MKMKLMTLCLATLAAVSLLALTACGNGSALTETASDISSFEEASSAESEVTSEVESNVIAEEPIGSAEQPIEEPVNTTTNDTNAGGQTNQNNGTTYAPPSNGNVNTGGNNGGSTNTGTATKPQQQQQQTAAPAQTQPIVHQPIYRQQWVVDQAAWSEEVPVYGTQVYDACNGCGIDITSDPWGHIEAQLLAGNMKCGGYHTEYRQVQTGTKTVY